MARVEVARAQPVPDTCVPWTSFRAGSLMVEFMVQADGTLTDARVLKALRLIRMAPKWEPATFQGKPLKQKMVLPVLFQL